MLEDTTSVQTQNEQTSSGDAKSSTTANVANLSEKELEKLDKIFSKGINESNNRWRDVIREAIPGLDEVADEDLTPTTLRKLIKDSQKAEPKKKEGETEKEFQERLKAEQEKSARYKQEADSLRDQLAQTEIRSHVEKSIPDNVVNTTKVARAFLAEYTVKKTADGQIKVYDSSNKIVRDAQFDEATVEYAMAKFLADNPWFIKASAKTGVNLSEMMGLPAGTKAEHQKNMPNDDKMSLAEKLMDGKSSIK